MDILQKNRVFIIAEAGVNHNGSIELAKKLIDAGVEAKVDAVKFQTFIAENVISKYAEKADYQKDTTSSDESQLEMVKQLELSFEDFKELKTYCEQKGMMFLSTPFDMDSIKFLETLKMGLWKIPSGEITNLPYLQKIGSYNEKIIFSTGMSTLGDIENAIDILVKAGTSRENITILHCNTEYPTPMDDVNLKAMQTIKNAFGVNVGYSDHTLGIEVPIAAVALGATVIEKHFTLDKSMKGPDHLASLEPNELKLMVQGIRNIEEALGTAIKLPSASESKNIKIARKSIHLAKDIKKGHLFGMDDLIIKRPGNGISPLFINEIIGCRAKSDLLEDSILNFKDIEWK
ncbi:N-acetylneuraminate synthase [Elizabethkingia meningoseptica]|uniref:N-acetylneuraminate synthase n=1 Tax=Elizabethkingia meningoseptica TaxID=238 RepID=UPI002DD6B4F2|nr:N-acetylneuraminate synthase [Elizabethkingia meningoseptica]MEC4712258.1 N-acetylneuraminate synthase [Elizabethkingia meningoseptica]